MPLFIPAHPLDLAITMVVLASQWPLAHFLRRDLRPRISHRAWLAILAALSVIWTIALVSMVLNVFAFRTPALWLVWLRTVSGAVELSWGCFTLCAVAVYALFRLVAGRNPNRFSPGRRLALKTATTAGMAAPFAAGTFGFIVERKQFYVKELDFPVPGLHPDLSGLRLVQISDLHVSPYLSVRDAARVVDMANELRADIALVTGDIISDFGDPLEESIRELGRLRATAGILACHGNHEIYARCQGLATRLGKQQGIRFLRDEATQLRFGNGILNVAGVDFQPSRARGNYLPGAEALVVPGVTNLLLSHSPDVFPTAVAKGFDAILSGHTHGGQVTVEILNRTLNVARFVTPYVTGLYRIQGRSCYVTPGIGTIGLPVRLGVPPEISLLRLRPA